MLKGLVKNAVELKDILTSNEYAQWLEKAIRNYENNLYEHRIVEIQIESFPLPAYFYDFNTEDIYFNSLFKKQIQGKLLASLTTEEIKKAFCIAVMQNKEEDIHDFYVPLLYLADEYVELKIVKKNTNLNGIEGELGVFEVVDNSEKGKAFKINKFNKDIHRLVFRLLNDAVFVLKDKKIVSCNQKTLNILGYDKQEIIGLTPAQISPELQPDGMRSEEKADNYLFEAEKRGKTFFYWVHLKKNGEFAHCEISLSSFKYCSETFLIAIIRDVSLRIEYQLKLKEREALFRAITENLPDYISKIDSSFNYVYVSPNLENLLGLMSAQIIGKSFADIFNKKEAAILMEHALKVVSQKVTSELVCTFKDVTNKEIILDCRIVPQLNQSEEVESCIILARDITNVFKKEKALKESEEKYRKLLRMVPLTVFKIDKIGKIEYVNDFGLKVFGYSREEFEKGFTVFDILDKNEIPRFLSRYKMVLAEDPIHAEYLFRRKNGEVFSGIVYLSYLFQNGEVVGAKGALVDISDRKEYEKQLIDAKLKAEESDRLKSAFLANISHEIRTPMNSIIGFSELLLKDDFYSEKDRKDFVNIIYSNASYLLILINDLLDISKIEAGVLRLEIKDVNIYEVISSIVHQSHINLSFYHKSNLEFVFDEDLLDKSLVINTDRVRLKQIISNLVINAIKFTEVGRIQVGYYVNNNEVIFYVKDTGIGISKEKQSVIFDRFRQADESIIHKYGGTGLGLTISMALAKMLGGYIRLDSEINKGSVFYLHLPCVIGDSNLKNKIELEINHLCPNLEGKLIVIADDQEMIHKYLEIILKPTKATIIHAYNGEEVLLFLKENPKVELILMDIQMPKLSGYDAIDYIKTDYSHVKVIAQTAFAENSEREKTLSAGFDDYISKPINKKELFAKINRLIR